MRRLQKFIIAAAALLFASGASNLASAQLGLFGGVKTGLEVLQDSHFKELKGKRVGLVTNPTGVDSDLNSNIDIFYNAPNVKLVALYAP